MKQPNCSRMAVGRRIGVACLGLACGASLWTSSLFAQQPVADPLAEQIAALRAAGEIGAANDLAASVREPAGNAPARNVDPQNLLGGGQANFGQIIQMITMFTGDNWNDQTGEEGGAPAPFPYQQGIKVDPHGVIALRGQVDNSGRVAAIGNEARKASLNDDMAAPSALRMVSLTRLEREVSRRLADGKSAVESMRNLAGLSRIQYVFVYPESGDVVIAGPAEGWQYNELGMAFGQTSGVPTLQLDDLVMVLRTFGPSGHAVFGCSIDPRQENMKAVYEYATQSQTRGPLTPSGTRSWANRIGTLLGLQDVAVFGVPANSRVAGVMVEADYRMKLIGTGKLEGGSDIPDYFELLAKNPSAISGGMDAMRWWMTMKCEAVTHSPERDAFEIKGSSVLCQSENQFLTAGGQHIPTGKAEPVNQKFAENFTEQFAKLAQRDPIFADLQGIFDLALAAALIQRENLDLKAGWDRGAFAVGGKYRPATYAAPKAAPTVVNYKVFNGKDVVLQAAGGVRADVAALLNDPQLHQEAPRLGSIAADAKADELPAGRWWWDVK